MKKAEIILVGGGGHCKSCIDVIELENIYTIKGIIDLPKEIGKTTLEYKVIGNDNELSKYAKAGYSFLITLGHMENSKRRNELYKIIRENGGRLPVITSPNAQISKYAKVGEGTIIMHHAVLNANASIGKNCIINSKALIEHDVVIGNNCHISTNVAVNGSSRIFDNCFLGSGSIIKNNIVINENIFIGMGSIVTKSILEKGKYFGNPAKKI